MSTTRWNLVVSQETDDALRRVLAAEGHARIVEVETEAAKRANAGRTEAEIAGAVDEALGWARRRR